MKILIDRLHDKDNNSMVLWEDIKEIAKTIQLALYDYGATVIFWEVQKIVDDPYEIMMCWHVSVVSPINIPYSLLARLLGDIKEEYDVKLEIIE